MALRRVFRIDDPEDYKTLKTPCRPVKLPQPGMNRLVTDMFETMHENHGLGFAAPQIGLSIRLVVIEIPAIHEKQEDGTEVEVTPARKYVLLNPRIVKMSPEEIISFEGCLSLPGWYGDVPRAEWVTVEYQEPNGKQRRLRKVDGILGRVVQHEIDHLDGILFTERIRDISTLREITEEEFEEMERQAAEEEAREHEADEHETSATREETRKLPARASAEATSEEEEEGEQDDIEAIERVAA
ncbi:MAG: peptide deformylase [Chloroflexaceae bacterium]|nr:peptide deformylase [Chloroflexaceae bacterium]